MRGTEKRTESEKEQMCRRRVESGNTSGPLVGGAGAFLKENVLSVFMFSSQSYFKCRELSGPV